MKEYMNNKPFTHICRLGTVFHCEKCDLSRKIYYSGAPDGCHSKLKMEAFGKDVAEMIGYHAVNIRPELNGFAGYDCLVFEFGPV